MMFDTESFDKLPVAFKTLIGFALFCAGISQIAFASMWSNGDIRFLYVFVALGVMFVVNGLPAMIDGIMTMTKGGITLFDKKV